MPQFISYKTQMNLPEMGLPEMGLPEVSHPSMNNKDVYLGDMNLPEMSKADNAFAQKDKPSAVQMTLPLASQFSYTEAMSTEAQSRTLQKTQVSSQQSGRYTQTSMQS